MRTWVSLPFPLSKPPKHALADVIDALLLEDHHISPVRPEGVESREHGDITVTKQGGVLRVHQLHGSRPQQFRRLRLHGATGADAVDGATIRVELLPRFQLVPTQLRTDQLTLNAVLTQYSVVDDETSQHVDHEADSDRGLEAALLLRPVVADIQVSRSVTRPVQLRVHTKHSTARLGQCVGRDTVQLVLDGSRDLCKRLTVQTTTDNHQRGGPHQPRLAEAALLRR